MKFSAVSIALAALPFALGGLIAEPIAARNGHIVEIAQQKNEHEGKQQSAQQLAEVIQLQGNQHAVVQEIIILWVNNGGGATTTVVNAAATTAAAAAAAATHTVCRDFISLFSKSFVNKCRLLLVVVPASFSFPTLSTLLLATLLFSSSTPRTTPSHNLLSTHLA